jgi:hypothetical protein
MIYKNKGIVMADYIIENVFRNLCLDVELNGWIDAFNNCREQGYIVYLYDGKGRLDDYLTIYVYQHRNTDLPTLSWDYRFGGQIYDEDTWVNRTESFEDMDGAIEKMTELIAERFRN